MDTFNKYPINPMAYFAKNIEAFPYETRKQHHPKGNGIFMNNGNILDCHDGRNIVWDTSEEDLRLNKDPVYVDSVDPPPELVNVLFGVRDIYDIEVDEFGTIILQPK